MNNYQGLPSVMQGFFGAQDRERQNQTSQLQQAQGIMQLKGLLAKRQEEEQIKGVLSQAQGDPAVALKGLLSLGTPQAVQMAGHLNKILEDQSQIPVRQAQAAQMQQRTAAGNALSNLSIGGGYRGNAENPVVSPPTGVMMNPDAARQAAIEADARGERVAINVPNPQNVQALAIAADPARAIPELLRQGRAPNQNPLSNIRPVAGGYLEKQPDGSAKFVRTAPENQKVVATADGYMTQDDAVRTRAKPASMLGGSAIDDKSARNIAIESLYDPNATTGFRRSPQIMKQITEERTKVMEESGITPQDVVSGRAGFKADTMSLNKITPQYDAITAFENTAIRNGKILIGLADKVDTTGVPVMEKWIRAGRKSIGGDPDVSRFNAQIRLYGAEVARILTQPNLSGVLTDTARKEVEGFLPESATPEQVKQVVNLLEMDFNNRKHTLEEQIAAIRDRMNKRVSPGGATAPAAPTAAPQRAQPTISDDDLIGKYLRPKAP